MTDETTSDPPKAPRSKSWLDAIKKEHALAFGALGFIVGVIGLYVGLRTPTAPARTVASGPPPNGPAASARSGAPGPPRTEPKPVELLKLATPAAKPHLLADFGAVEEVEGRKVVANSGPAPSLRFDVDADERGMMITFVAMANGEVGPQHVALLVDEREVGRVYIDVPWTRARLTLASGVIRPGPHVLTLALAGTKDKQVARAILFESVAIEPLPAAASILCGAAASKPLLASGWSWPEHDEKRLGVWSDGNSSRTNLMLLPRGSEYWLSVTAKAHQALPDKSLRVDVEVNQRKVGALEIGKEWDAHHLLVETSALRPGTNAIDFRYPATSELEAPAPDQKARRVAIMVERIGLHPTSQAVNVEVGHPDDRWYLVSGFTPDPPWGAPKRFVFSEGKRSLMSLPLKPADGAYRLELTAFAFQPLAPVEVEVRVNDAEPIGKVELGAEDKKYELTIPADTLVAGANRIVFKYSKTGKPSELLEGSDDVRELAAGISVVHVHPAK